MADELACQLSEVDPATKLWRFMDLPSYLASMLHRGLFFRRLTSLKDPFEGNLPIRSYESLRKTLCDSGIGDGVEKVVSDIRYGTETMPKIWLVNCWRMDDRESYIWRLYSDCDLEIALVTTAGKLKSLMPTEAILRVVDYRDYQTDPPPWGNSSIAASTKRHGYEFEKELRILLFDTEVIATNAAIADYEPVHEDGEWIQIALPDLVDKLVVSPHFPSWFLEPLDQISRRLGYSWPIIRSSMSSTIEKMGG
jgi:hypothetical protein